MLSRLRYVLEWPLRFLFGRDVFISYARNDGVDAYVRKLAEHLRNAKPRAISYFLDLHAAPADRVIPPAALRYARWCRVFVLIASKRALRDGGGAMKEVCKFVQRPKRLFVPVDVDGAYDARNSSADPWTLVSGSPSERETAEAAEAGVVSPQVVERIESLVGNQRFERRLTLASLLALVLILAGSVFTVLSFIAWGDAKANRLAAESGVAVKTNFARSLLLAAEAVDLRPGFLDAQAAILEALLRHGGLVTLLHAPPQRLDENLATDVSALAVSPDGSIVASGLQSMATAAFRPDDATTFAFSRDGAYAVTGNDHGELRVFERRRRTAGDRQQVSLNGQIWSVVASPADPALFAASDENGHIVTFRPGSPQIALQSTRSEPVLSFSEDGRRLVATTNDGVAIFTIPDLRPEGRFTYAARPLCAAFAGRLVLTGNRDSTIALFSLDAMDRFGGAPVIESRRSRAVVSSPVTRERAVSADGRRVAELVGGDGDRRLAVYDAKSKRLWRRYELENPSTTTVAIDARGERVATADLPNGTIIIRSVDRGTELLRFTEGDDQVLAMAFSADGRRFAASDPAGVTLYSLDPPRAIGTIPALANCLQFSPDGKTLDVCDPGDRRSWMMDSAGWRDLARRIAGRTLSPSERREFVDVR